jgi:hypothetical protein
VIGKTNGYAGTTNEIYAILLINENKPPQTKDKAFRNYSL